MKSIKAKGIQAVVYEPALRDDELHNSKVIKDLEQFKQQVDVIIAARRSPALADVESYV